MSSLSIPRCAAMVLEVCYLRHVRNCNITVTVKLQRLYVWRRHARETARRTYINIYRHTYIQTDRQTAGGDIDVRCRRVMTDGPSSWNEMLLNQEMSSHCLTRIRWCLARRTPTDHIDHIRWPHKATPHTARDNMWSACNHDHWPNVTQVGRLNFFAFQNCFQLHLPERFTDTITPAHLVFSFSRGESKVMAYLNRELT